jgi:hypothetical protein
MSRGLKGLKERWPKLYWTQRGTSVFVGYEQPESLGRYGRFELGPEQITVERVGSGRWLARDMSGPHKTAFGQTAEQAVEGLAKADGEGK